MYKRMKSLSLPAILGQLTFLIALLTTTAVPPAEGFSVGDEREVGEKIQSLIRRDFKLIDRPDVAQYINDLGRQVLATAGPQYFNYQFFVIDNSDFNAFAAPSGLIFIHSGLITSMDKENELVGVIAHEIGHVTSRHLADRIENASKVNIGTVAMILAGIALGSSGEGELSEAVVAGALATSATLNLKFSRENEEEADRVAFNWMVKLGRDPGSLLSMLGKMRRISILKIGKIPTYLLTHPDPAPRMGYVSDLLNAYPGRLPATTRNNFAFQRIRFLILADTRDNRNLVLRLQKRIDNGDDHDYMARLGLTQVYLHEGDFSKARKYLTELIKKFPEQAILKTDLGITYFKEGKTQKAQEIFRESLKSDRNCAFTILNLARALEQDNKLDKAIELYEELLAITPTFTKSHYYLGHARTKVGQAGLGHYHTGLYSWLAGNSELARYHLGKALELLPADSPYRIRSKEMLTKIIRLEKL
jgi:predicted Zn-dependent protease